MCKWKRIHLDYWANNGLNDCFCACASELGIFRTMSASGRWTYMLYELFQPRGESMYLRRVIDYSKSFEAMNKLMLTSRLEI